MTAGLGFNVTTHSSRDADRDGYDGFLCYVIIYYYYLHVRVGVSHTSMIHNFAYAEHDKQDYDRGKN